MRELEGRANTFIATTQQFEFFDATSGARLCQRLEELNTVVIDQLFFWNN
jgi:hypothetical protein